MQFQWTMKQNILLELYTNLMLASIELFYQKSELFISCIKCTQIDAHSTCRKFQSSMSNRRDWWKKSSWKQFAKVSMNSKRDENAAIAPLNGWKIHGKSFCGRRTKYVQKTAHTARKNGNKNAHQKVKMLELGEAMTGKKKQQNAKIKMPNTVFVCVLLYFWFWNLTKCTARLPAHRFAINFWANDGGRAEQNSVFLWHGCERGAATTKINERGGKKAKEFDFYILLSFFRRRMQQRQQQ